MFVTLFSLADLQELLPDSYDPHNTTDVPLQKLP